MRPWGTKMFVWTSRIRIWCLLYSTGPLGDLLIGYLNFESENFDIFRKFLKLLKSFETFEFFLIFF